jgi:hypothetical protein
MYVREIRWGGMEWIDLVQDKDYGGVFCEHGNELSCSIQSWEILE